MGRVCKEYPSDVTDEEWWFVLPYLWLCREDAGYASGWRVTTRFYDS